MTDKRFEIENGFYEAKDRPLIFDNYSDDDYYFCGDYDDFKSLCELLNQLNDENNQLKQVLSDLAKDHEVTVEDLILWSEELRK